MRRALPLLLLFTLACNAFASRLTPPTAMVGVTPTRPRAASTGVQLNAPTASLAPTRTPAPQPTLTGTPDPAPGLRPEDITFHPDPQLYSGDIVSLELDAAHSDPAWEDATVKLYADALAGQPIATAQFGRFGIGNNAQATFFWDWDTQGREGPQTLLVAIVPPGADSVPLEVLTLTVNLLPAAQRPAPEPVAQWAQSESACCRFHYLTHTAAARDIELIMTEADAALEQVEQTLGVQAQEKVPFTLLSRLLGHGGFASSEISLTYIDRNPAGNHFPTVLEHELTHILDRDFSDQRPAFMVEGLAVYVAQGHYKPEDLDTRAAALLALDRYLPLGDLAENFYTAQHEIGYLQAGGFVKFLVDTYGWEKFKAFYSAFPNDASPRGMIERALRANFDKSLTELEADWLAHLRSLTPTAAQIDDLLFTVELFDTLRRYQQMDDPSAYFLTAWLPDGPEGRERNITADFMRHPTSPENIALETMLAEAERALGAGDYAKIQPLLDSVNAVLEAHNLFTDPLAAQYLQIVTTVHGRGYEVQTITLADERAGVTAIANWPALETLTLNHTASGWK